MARTRSSNIRLAGAFCFALAPLIFLTPWFPQWPLTYFAPFLVIAYYKKPFETCLWLSLICGLIMDLLSSHRHLGLFALNYCLVTTLLYSQKQHFFEDSVSTLPIMCFFFAIVSTLVQVPLHHVFESPIVLAHDWWLNDLILMPSIDALYGLVWFTLPGLFLPRKSNREYFLDDPSS